jgi:hypothetical protein
MFAQKETTASTMGLDIERPIELTAKSDLLGRSPSVLPGQRPPDQDPPIAPFQREVNSGILFHGCPADTLGSAKSPLFFHLAGIAANTCSG